MGIPRPLLALVLALLAVVPASARAHSGAGSATDYRITGIATEPAGLPVRVSALGGDDRLRLRWDGGGELVVLGYAGEPYLRLTPDGAFENRRSPSVEPNASRYGEVVGRDALPGGAPSWRRIADEPVAVWHDHRSHWMARTRPAAVQRDPGRRQVVQGWSIPLRIDGRSALMTGRLEWVPPPRTAWWAIAALVLGLALALAAARAPAPAARATARLAAALAVGCGAALGVGDALAAPRSGYTTGISPALPPLVLAVLWAAAVPAALAAWLTARRRDPAAEAAVLVAAAWLVGGAALLGRLGLLAHSVVPSAVPAAAARLLMVAGLAGLAAPAVWAWRQAGAVRRRGRGAAPAPGWAAPRREGRAADE